MKNLKDVILEKLKVDDIILDVKFPVDGTVEDMIKFLEEEGFEDFQVNDGTIIDEEFNSEKSKCFTTLVNSAYKSIWFADTSKRKISKENPIFYIWFNESMYSVYYTNNNGNCVNIVNNDKKKFLIELNKRFGWQ